MIISMNATNDGSNDTIGKDYVSRINELLRQNNGLISATDARSRQIPTIYLSRLYKAGRLQKIRSWSIRKRRRTFRQPLYFSIPLHENYLFIRNSSLSIKSDGYSAA